MKKTKLFLGALSLLAFAACSDDKNAPAPDTVLNDGSESFITVRIMDAFSQDGARATDYENGSSVNDGTTTYEESLIKSLTIAFYDINKNFITFGVANELDIKPTEPTGGNLETISEAEVKLTLKPNDPTPAYAIAFANPIQNQPSLSNIDATQTSTRDSWGNSTAKDGKTTYLFAMNNSVYFSKTAHERQVAVSVTTDNFYKSDTSADDKKNIPAVDFYIERIAGKVILHGPSASTTTIPVENVEASVDGTNKYLVFVPEKWGLNATEQTTYLMKNFTQEYTTLQTNLDWGTTLWNDPDNHRSYWAHSPSFASSDFPDVSDDVDDKKGDYKLKYTSYKSIATSGANIGNCQYTLENTKQRSSFNKNSALISAVVIGHYEIRSKDAATTKTDPVSFYKRTGSIYLEDDFWSAMASTQHVIMKLKSSTETANTYEALSATELKGITKIYHPKKSSLGDKVAENLVSIELKDGATLNDYYIRNDEGEYKKYNESGLSTEAINNHLLVQCGMMEAYTDGKAYFNIPVEHLGRMIENNPTAGYYGVVRNHTYDIAVEKIMNTAMATGVFDETKPIVPSTITDKYSFKANLKVLAWRMVRKNVTLGEK